MTAARALLGAVVVLAAAGALLGGPVGIGLLGLAAVALVVRTLMSG